MHQKNRWGLLLFGLAAAMVVGCFLLIAGYPAQNYPALYSRVAPWTGIALSALALLTGHFSYPRVHNLKVYLAGYLTGIAGLGFFLLFAPPAQMDQPLRAVYLLVFINMIIILTIPAYVKYRTTKQITFTIAGMEAALIAALFFAPRLSEWTAILSRRSIAALPAYIGMIWLTGIAAATIPALRREFYLGGLFTGVSLFYAVAWIAPMVAASDRSLEVLMWAAAPLYLEIGTLVHWFSRMEHRISYDPLLHIYNRNYCSKIIAEQSNISTTPPFGVAMIDIDHFKKVNDTHGHQAGDAVLFHVAQTILREVVPDGIACRYGGEEITVFFPKKDTRQVSQIIEKVRAAIEKMKTQNGRKKLSVTISSGVSHRADASQDIMQVIEAADKALYRAKKSGRNQVKTGKTPLATAKKRG